MWRFALFIYVYLLISELWDFLHHPQKIPNPAFFCWKFMCVADRKLKFGNNSFI